MAAQLMAMKSWCCRALNLWMARATTSLPHPLSPVINTGAVDREARPMSLKTLCMAGLWPMMDCWRLSSGGGVAAVLRIDSRVFSASSTTGRSS